MNPDQTLIQSAYEAAIRELYEALFKNYAASGGDATAEQQANQSFVSGVALARKARDKAVALLD